MTAINVTNQGSASSKVGQFEARLLSNGAIKIAGPTDYMQERGNDKLSRYLNFRPDLVTEAVPPEKFIDVLKQLQADYEEWNNLTMNSHITTDSLTIVKRCFSGPL